MGLDYKKKKMSTDRESGRGNKRAGVTRASRNPKHGKRKALHCVKLGLVSLGTSIAIPPHQRQARARLPTRYCPPLGIASYKKSDAAFRRTKTYQNVPERTETYRNKVKRTKQFQNVLNVPKRTNHTKTYQFYRHKISCMSRYTLVYELFVIRNVFPHFHG
jgi:hypothetical protein